MLNILSNGSKWAGEEPDSIDTLLDVLSKYPLDRMFEEYGNFVQDDPKWARGIRNPVTGCVDHYDYSTPYPDNPDVTVFWGNFYRLSHVFNIHTDEPEIIKKLTTAIRANQQREDYLSQSVPLQQE